MAELKTKIKLILRAQNLTTKDLFSKSDPFAVVYLKSQPQTDNDSGTWKEIARTSTVKNNNNPQWRDLIFVDYHFEQVQYIKFEIYDRDAESEKLSAHDFLGYFETNLAAIMGSRGCAVNTLLKDKKGKDQKKARLIVVGEQQSATKDLLEFQFRAEKLERKNFFGMGKSDPFYTILQKQSDDRFSPVFTSEVLKSNLNPKWVVKKVPVQLICNGDLDRQIRIDVHDFESSGKHQLIGSFVTTVNTLLKTSSFDLLNLKKSKNTCGKFFVSGCKILKRSGFLDYIEGGCEIKLSVAIDFTGSNGHPLDARSLHAMPQNFHFNEQMQNYAGLNEYQKAILCVTRVLENYDTDKMIPVYGFGANLQTLPNQHLLNMHCFPLTFNTEQREVLGVSGVMNLYQRALQTVGLSGPTYFEHIIRTAIEDAGEPSQENQSYSVLLIITDGIINDMASTIDQIVVASRVPLSIVIVGVGNADFSNMTALDNDDGAPLASRGVSAARDIVQFVPFKKFEGNATLLGEETLREIPRQMEDYFTMMGISANPKRPAPPVMEAEIVAVNESDYVPMGKVEEPTAEFYPDLSQ